MLNVLDSWFYSLGCVISDRPKSIILFSIVLTLLAATGVGNLVMENQGLYLWIPQDNEDWRNFEFNRDTFGGQPRDSLALITSKVEGGNLLNHDAMVAVMEFHTNLTTVIASPDGGETFQDLCFKTSVGCDTNNFLSIWNYDKANIPADDATIITQINYFATLLPIDITFGGLTYTGDVVTGAQSIRLQYAITNNDQAAAMAWEQAILDWTEPYKSSHINIHRITKRSIDDEVVRLVSGDSPLFAAAILAIVSWLACTFGKLNKVESRFLITWMVLVEILFCLLFAFGMLGYCGFIMSSLNAMVPFIVAGVSVDDMIVIEDFYNKAAGKPQRLGETMRAAGVAITITSVTSIVAFASGAVLDMPGVASFCLTCAFAFTWDFFLNVTLFPALLELDQRRIEAKKHFLCPCCITVDDFEFTDAVTERRSNARRLTVDSAGFDTRESEFNRNTYVDIKGEKTTVTEMSMEAFMNQKFGPFLTKKWVQILVVALSIGAAGACGYFSTLTPTGIDVKNVVPDDSYITVYIDQVARYWSGEGVRPLSLVVRDLDFTDASEVAKLEGLFGWIEEQSYTASKVGTAAGHWYEKYVEYLEAEGKDRYADFNGHLVDFLETDVGKGYYADVKCETSLSLCSGIKTSRFFVWNKSRSNTAYLYEMSSEIQGKIDESGINMFAYTEEFLYAMTDSVMYDYIMSNLGLTLCLVFVVMLIFTDNVSCVFITLMVLMIDLDLLGIMYLWGVNISSVSFVCLVMSVGLSVDYCVHIGHAFTHSRGDTPNDRLVEAVKMMGTSVMKGGLTTFLGTVVLSGASSDAFRVFFKMLFSTVTLGVFHGIVCLPIFLAVFYSLLGAGGGGGSHASMDVVGRMSDSSIQMGGVKAGGAGGGQTF
jgi:predicted RND superfamily exporter protein